MVAGWCGARVHQRPLSADGSGVVAQIMREIDERKTFLDSMRQMGQGAMYEAQISAEISQRIALLERIDRQRVDAMRSQSLPPPPVRFPAVPRPAPPSLAPTSPVVPRTVLPQTAKRLSCLNGPPPKVCGSDSRVGWARWAGARCAMASDSG